MPRPTYNFARFAILASAAIVLLLAGSIVVHPAAAAPAAPAFTPSHWLYLPAINRNYDPSWQWSAVSPVITLVPAIASNSLPATALDRQGQVHLLWGIDSRAAEGKFIYHTALTASGWTTPAAILPTLGTSYSPSTPIVGPDGALHLLWLNKLTSNANPRLVYSVYRDGAWSAEEDVYDYPVASVGPGVMQTDRAGQVYAIFWYNGLYTYPYQAKRTLTGWTATLVPHTGSLDISFWFLGDRDGGIRRLLSRYENGQYHGYYSYWRDGSYLITDTLLPFATRDRYGQLDAGNNLHVYWRAEVPVSGGQVMGLYHQCFDPAMNSLSGPELLTGQEATTTALLPAADEAGRWTLAWQLAATGEAKIGVWHGCQRQKIVSVPQDQSVPWPPFRALFNQAPNRWCGVWKAGTTGYRVRCADIVAP